MKKISKALLLLTLLYVLGSFVYASLRWENDAVPGIEEHKQEQNTMNNDQTIALNKSAKWLDEEKTLAEVKIEIDTKTKLEDTDIIIVIDTSATAYEQFTGAYESTPQNRNKPSMGANEQFIDECFDAIAERFILGSYSGYDLQRSNNRIAVVEFDESGRLFKRTPSKVETVGVSIPRGNDNSLFNPKGKGNNTAKNLQLRQDVLDKRYPAYKTQIASKLGLTGGNTSDDFFFDKDNYAQVERAVRANIKSGSYTNIDLALVIPQVLLENRANTDRNSIVIVFSDGEPDPMVYAGSQMNGCVTITSNTQWYAYKEGIVCGHNKDANVRAKGTGTYPANYFYKIASDDIRNNANGSIFLVKTGRNTSHYNGAAFDAINAIWNYITGHVDNISNAKDANTYGRFPQIPYIGQISNDSTYAQRTTPGNHIFFAYEGSKKKKEQTIERINSILTDLINVYMWPTAKFTGTLTDKINSDKFEIVLNSWQAKIGDIDLTGNVSYDEVSHTIKWEFLADDEIYYGGFEELGGNPVLTFTIKLKEEYVETLGGWINTNEIEPEDNECVFDPDPDSPEDDVEIPSPWLDRDVEVEEGSYELILQYVDDSPSSNATITKTIKYTKDNLDDNDFVENSLLKNHINGYKSNVNQFIVEEDNVFATFGWKDKVIRTKGKIYINDEKIRYTDGGEESQEFGLLQDNEIVYHYNASEEKTLYSVRYFLVTGEKANNSDEITNIKIVGGAYRPEECTDIAVDVGKHVVIKSDTYLPDDLKDDQLIGSRGNDYARMLIEAEKMDDFVTSNSILENAQSFEFDAKAGANLYIDFIYLRTVAPTPKVSFYYRDINKKDLDLDDVDGDVATPRTGVSTKAGTYVGSIIVPNKKDINDWKFEEYETRPDVGYNWDITSSSAPINEGPQITEDLIVVYWYKQKDEQAEVEVLHLLEGTDDQLATNENNPEHPDVHPGNPYTPEARNIPGLVYTGNWKVNDVPQEQPLCEITIEEGKTIIKLYYKGPIITPEFVPDGEVDQLEPSRKDEFGNNRVVLDDLFSVKMNTSGTGSLAKGAGAKIMAKMPFDVFTNKKDTNDAVVHDAGSTFEVYDFAKEYKDKDPVITFRIPSYVQEKNYDNQVEFWLQFGGEETTHKKITITVIGRLYDFTVTKLIGDDIWSNSLFTGNNANIEYKADTLPIGQSKVKVEEFGSTILYNSNVQANQERTTQPNTYNYGIRLGSSFMFTINTKGLKSEKILIEPKLLYYPAGATIPDKSVVFKYIDPATNTEKDFADANGRVTREDQLVTQLNSDARRTDEFMNELLEALNTYANKDKNLTAGINSERQNFMSLVNAYYEIKLGNTPFGTSKLLEISKSLRLPYLYYARDAQLFRSETRLIGQDNRLKCFENTKLKQLYNFEKYGTGYLGNMADLVTEKVLVNSVCHWYAGYRLPNTLLVKRGNETLKDGFIVVLFKIYTQDGDKKTYLMYEQQNITKDIENNSRVVFNQWDIENATVKNASHVRNVNAPSVMANLQNKTNPASFTIDYSDGFFPVAIYDASAKLSQDAAMTH